MEIRCLGIGFPTCPTAEANLLSQAIWSFQFEVPHALVFIESGIGYRLGATCAWEADTFCRHAMRRLMLMACHDGRNAGTICIEWYMAATIEAQRPEETLIRMQG